jgi:hypothetical protein
MAFEAVEGRGVRCVRWEVVLKTAEMLAVAWGQAWAARLAGHDGGGAKRI